MKPVYLDHTTRTARPEDFEGDDFYGLALGTNGTAAICRRACYAPDGYTWVRHDGRHAIGVTLVPTANSNSTPNPWDGGES